MQENHSAPVVAVRFYVKTGSIYEGSHLGAGISHLFEHVLGDGTKTQTKEQLNDAVQAIGGQSNAYTTNDKTAYFITTASRYFDQALGVLSDEMQNATFPEAEVKTQQGIIHNEMNLGEDDPDRVLWKLFYNTAFLVHPVRYPVIGYSEIFDRLTRDDIQNYYDSHYTPDNTVLSVAGDVRAEDVFAAAQKQLGSWERRAPSTPTLPEEPNQVSPRRAVVEKDVQIAQVMMGWHTVPLQHFDLYALDVLSQVLGGGESSRLVRSLREDKNLVTSIGAFSSTPSYGAGIFGVSASMPPQNLSKFEPAVWEEIEKIKKDGVSFEEVRRAQRQMETSFVFDNEDVADQAERIATDFMSTGDATFSEHYVERIKRVTPAQVRQAAWKYLWESGTTTAIVKPRSKTGVAALPETGAPNVGAPVATTPIKTMPRQPQVAPARSDRSAQRDASHHPRKPRDADRINGGDGLGRRAFGTGQQSRHRQSRRRNADARHDGTQRRRIGAGRGRDGWLVGRDRRLQFMGDELPVAGARLAARPDFNAGIVFEADFPRR